MKNVIKRTVKRKEEVVFPAITSDIIQSNRVTNARFNFTNMQLKIFIDVMTSLQQAIDKSMKGANYQQLDIFREGMDVIEIPVLLKNLATKKYYNEVISAARELQSVPVYFKSTRRGEEYINVASLFAQVSLPQTYKNNKAIYVKMLKETATYLIDIDRNEKGQPIHYTKYIREIALSTNSKYTTLLYMKISSWKTKGGFYITLDNLRKDLGINNDEYLDYRDFKKRILQPAQVKLEKKADCWFNCKEKAFEEKAGNKVIGINFKVITPEFDKMQEKLRESIKRVLRTHMKLTDADIKQLEPVLAHNDLNEVQVKIVQLNDYIKENRGKIGNKQAYIVTSLLKQFSNLSLKEAK